MKKIFSNMHKLAIFATGVVIIPAMLCGCTKNFRDYNTNPYGFYGYDHSWLTNLMYAMTTSQENDSQMIDQMIGGDYGGYFTLSNSWQGTNFTTYNPADAWIDYPFKTIMPILYGNYFTGTRQTEGKGPLFALGQILRVFITLKLTDMYGPMPYSKVGGGTFTTEYDSVKDLYGYMLTDLSSAVDVLTSYISASGNAKPIEDYDPIYGSDFTKWVRFANSMRLRMAIRISSIDPALAQSTAEAAVNHSIGVITTNADNAFTPTIDNPYLKAVGWGDLRANASIVSYMNGYVDPRLSTYFTVSDYLAYPYVGIRAGMTITSGNLTNYRRLSAPKYLVSDPMPVMYASEVAFLLAEGKLKGWNVSADNVKTLYERGVSLSFEQRGVAASAAVTYLAGTTAPAAYIDPVIAANNTAAVSTVTVKWDDSATAAVKLERLLIQKWIAMYPLGFESWSDFRRTGYPQMFKAVNNLSPASTPVNTTRMARRIKFPPSEYQQNPDNIANAITKLGGIDSQATDLWWAKTN